MPTIAENKREWDGQYVWAEKGEEWSGPWGETALQWYATLLPRIHRFVPAPTILEIACGYGRWTQYLKDLCERLILVDLSKECIDACRERFASAQHLEYHVNNGTSLSMIADSSVDFAFTFDSLVHVEPAVLSAYFAEFRRVLSPNGVAFIHHSNLGEYRDKYQMIRHIPKLEGLLITMKVLDPFLHWRDPGVSAGEVERLASANGLRCITQEIVHWRTDRAMIDCISTIVKQGSSLERPNMLFRNPHFMHEAKNAAQLSQFYGRGARR